jgi:ferredoxin--NADP+ reductase
MEVQKPIEGIFVGGWARKASDGLVGYARKDGINAAKAVWGYLQTKQPDVSALKAVTSKITGLHKPAVTKADILRLEAIETEEARKRGVEEFKFSSNEDMLRAMGLTIAA